MRAINQIRAVHASREQVRPSFGLIRRPCACEKLDWLAGFSAYAYRKAAAQTRVRILRLLVRPQPVSETKYHWYIEAAIDMALPATTASIICVGLPQESMA